MDVLSRFVLRHKLAVVLCWVVVLVAGGFAASRLPDRLSYQFGFPGEEGYEANVAILERYGNGGPANPLVPVMTLPRGTTVDSPGVAQRLAGASQALAERGLRVLSYPQTGDRDAFVSDHGRRVYALVFLPYLGDEEPPPELVNGVRAAFAGALPPGTEITLTGLDQLAEQAAESGNDNGVLAETLLGALGAVLVLAFVFGSLLALLPLLMAAFAILASFLALSGMVEVTEVPFMVQYVVALIGLGIAIDYSLLVVTRWREEREHGHDPETAVVRAMGTAGRAVLLSGLTVTVGLLVLVVLPIPFIRALGLASMLVPAFSVLAALTLLPVLLATAGARADWPRLRKEAKPSRMWTWWAAGVSRRPLLAIVLALALLVPLCVVALGMRLGLTPSDAVARSGAAYEAFVDLKQAGVPAGVLTPIDVLVPAGTDPAAVADRLDTVDGVAYAAAPQGPDWRRDGTALVTVIPVHEAATTAGEDTAARVTRVAGEFPGVRVGGAAAMNIAQSEALYGSFGYLLGLVALATFVLLVRAFRSVLLATQALVLNLLSIGAAYGVLVLVWQEGYGSRALWDIPPLGSVTTFVPLVTFAFLFGLSMDYEVFLLSRMRESYDATGSTVAAIREGLGRVGRLVTAAALILFLAFVSLAAVPEVDVKVMATALGAGILIDATVLRMLLVPALVAACGRWTWWLPTWMARALRVEPSAAAPPDSTTRRVEVGA